MPTVRALDLKELKSIYHDYMRTDFPFGELRPYASMAKMARDDKYQMYGYFEEGELLGYACFILQKPTGYALMDYFAVLPKLRNQGVGSMFLQAVRPFVPTLNGIFIEAESPSSAKSAEECEIRSRRIQFYQRNGAALTASKCLLFHVDYNILLFPGESGFPTEEEIFEALKDFYRKLFKPAVGNLCKPYFVGEIADRQQHCQY